MVRPDPGPDPAAPIRVLLVEDDVDDALAATQALSASQGFRVSHVRLAADALAACAKTKFDLCLLDYLLPDRSGLQLAKELRSRGVSCPMFLVTSIRSDTVAAQALRAGIDDLIIKGEDYRDRLAHEVPARLKEARLRS